MRAIVAAKSGSRLAFQVFLAATGSQPRAGSGRPTRADLDPRVLAE
jgi:hypothetical protein